MEGNFLKRRLPIAGKENSHSLPVGGQNSPPTLEDGLAFSCKAKHSVDICSSLVHLDIHSTDLKTYMYTNLHETVYSSSIHNHPKLLPTKMSYTR